MRAVEKAGKEREQRQLVQGVNCSKLKEKRKEKKEKGKERWNCWNAQMGPPLKQKKKKKLGHLSVVVGIPPAIHLQYENLHHPIQAQGLLARTCLWPKDRVKYLWVKARLWPSPIIKLPWNQSTHLVPLLDQELFISFSSWIFYTSTLRDPNSYLSCRYRVTTKDPSQWLMGYLWSNLHMISASFFHTRPNQSWDMGPTCGKELHKSLHGSGLYSSSGLSAESNRKMLKDDCVGGGNNEQGRERLI